MKKLFTDAVCAHVLEVLALPRANRFRKVALTGSRRLRAAAPIFSRALLSRLPSTVSLPFTLVCVLTVVRVCVLQMFGGMGGGGMGGGGQRFYRS